MKPHIEIRRNVDGVVREWDDDCDWLGDYIWSDGNYACDCNRYLFFMRAANEDEGELIDDRCGDDAYSIRITDGGGKLLYQDGDWPWRKETHDRISAMAGVSPEGAILPPEPGIGIDRSPKSWWKNMAL